MVGPGEGGLLAEALITPTSMRCQWLVRMEAMKGPSGSRVTLHLMKKGVCYFFSPSFFEYVMEWKMKI